jgi:serine/threonine protein kinase
MLLTSCCVDFCPQLLCVLHCMLATTSMVGAHLELIVEFFCNTSRFFCMHIIQHICECLTDLHQADYVHRDLKPGNIMWLPSQNRWTLIDFGCAARIGEVARTGFSLMYAAPEVVMSHFREKSQTLRAAPALDVWSVGVIAVELFSGRPPLQIFQGQEQVSHLTVTSSWASHYQREISSIAQITSIDSRRNNQSRNLVLVLA